MIWCPLAFSSACLKCSSSFRVTRLAAPLVHLKGPQAACCLLLLLLYWNVYDIKTTRTNEFVYSSATVFELPQPSWCSFWPFLFLSLTSSCIETFGSRTLVWSPCPHNPQNTTATSCNWGLINGFLCVSVSKLGLLFPGKSDRFGSRPLTKCGLGKCFFLDTSVIIF